MEIKMRVDGDRLYEDSCCPDLFNAQEEVKILFTFPTGWQGIRLVNFNQDAHLWFPLQGDRVTIPPDLLREGLTVSLAGTNDVRLRHRSSYKQIRKGA